VESITKTLAKEDWTADDAAMAAGVTDQLWEISAVVGILEPWKAARKA
jgi:hypothetical protein